MTTRRTVLAGAGWLAGLTALATPYSSARSQAGHAPSPLPRPANRPIRVAFVLGTHRANVMDVAGPWEVFQDTMIDGQPAFELYTVAETEGPVTMTGGLRVLPDYITATAPQPDVIVIPAVGTTGLTIDWVRRMSLQTSMTMSVCTGAFVLAETGLLDNGPAATHHDYWEQFAADYPDIDLQRGSRFVDRGQIASAGGLTSGIDLALHIVERLFDRATA